MKRYTMEKRTQFLEAWKESCMSIKDFASEQNINVNTFKYWVMSTKRNSKEGQSFLPLTIIDDKETLYGNEHCVIKVGDFLSIECTKESNLQTIELALQAAVNICGHLFKI